MDVKLALITCLSGVGLAALTVYSWFTAIPLIVVVASDAAIIVSEMHALGYVPPRYKLVLSEIQHSTASSIGSEVEGALTRVAAQQTALAEEAEKAFANSTQMSMVRSVGVDKALQDKATSMIANGMLGNVLPILRMIVPGIADQLEENPQLIFTLIENPYFKKYVLPRIQAYLPSPGGETGAGQVSSGSGWGP